MNRHGQGFTLVELMIVVAIVTILATIAIPSYTNHIARTRTRGAMADLTALALALENLYQVNLAYPGQNTANTAATIALFTAGGAQNGTWTPAQSDNFDYTVTFDSTPGYALAATGKAGSSVAGCVVRLDSSNAKSAPSCPVQWN
ncbi:type IV pilin protein [Paludibacterium paludis]|uniref:Prepilin-type N-terminal cleavage/methylation domain-containing protein n=1 Tax=Paludibacterium paludis TaxID=1225769 RepID=A0A918U9T8_9NEIS|nr:type IV pilin protein [Paludibacterium paludis]GGY17653.1 prepilin-type N-terminal cleavage/methylation domain-containing protein [Paludibacterium paludis]